MKNQELLDNIYGLANYGGKDVLILTSNTSDMCLLHKYWGCNYNTFNMIFNSGGGLEICNWYDFTVKYNIEPDVLYVQSGSYYEHFVSNWEKTPSIIEFDISAGLISMKGPA